MLTNQELWEIIQLLPTADGAVKASYSVDDTTDVLSATVDEGTLVLHILPPEAILIGTIEETTEEITMEPPGPIDEAVVKYHEDNPANNNGGDTGYYDLPRDVETLQDLIEHKEFNFAQGEIFKAAYTLNDDSARKHSNKVRDLNKIIWYAQREIARISHGEERGTEEPSEGSAGS